MTGAPMPARKRKSAAKRVASDGGGKHAPTRLLAVDDSTVAPFDLAPPAEVRDPARAAAAVLLSRALRVASLAAEVVGRDGSICLVALPDAQWTEVVADAWRHAVRDGGRYQEGGATPSWHDCTWVAWIPDAEPAGYLRKDAENAFPRAIGKGLHCAGFSADPAWLPADLVLAADHRLVVPALAAEDIGAVATELCGGQARDAVSDAEAARLTPRLLRLARRPGQTADAYVGKLRAMLAADLPPAAPAKTASPREEPTLRCLHGMDEAVAWGMDVARDLAAYREGRLAWAGVDRGCLLSGPPGSGKTMYARALAATCGVPLVTGSYGVWHGTGNAHQGEFLKAMRSTFAEARESAPSVLFIDEVDSFPNRAMLTYSHADYMIQVVNALLAEVDGVDGREGVVLIGACNHPEKLDPALVRSGRLDRHVRIGLPGRAALAAIMREHLRDDLAGVDLSGAAMAAAGSSGADCERLVRGARRRARSSGRAMVLADLLDEVGGGGEGSDADGRLAAVHEAGHVVAACVLRPGSVGMASMRGAGDAGGMTEAALLRSVYLRPDDLRIRLVVLLAGRAAEEAVFGVASSGAGGTWDSDLGRATTAVLDAFAAFGLDDAGGGLVWRGIADAGGIPRALAADPALADRVRVRLDQAYDEALGLLHPRLAAVEAVAAALRERRVLDGPDAEAIVMAHEPCGGLQP